MKTYRELLLNRLAAMMGGWSFLTSCNTMATLVLILKSQDW